MSGSAKSREAIEKAVQQLSEGYGGVKEALDGLEAQDAPPRFLKAFFGALDTERCERAAWYRSLDGALEKIDAGHVTAPDGEVEVGGLWVSKATGHGHAVCLRIERYAVRDKDVPLTERDMLWLWRDDVWKHDKALQHRRRRLRHLLEAAEKLSGDSGADSCWVVYPVELDLERQDQVLSPIASDHDVALDSFDLSIALGFYALLRGIEGHEASRWWATGALTHGDGAGSLGAPVKGVTELDAKSCALADAGEAGILLYPTDNGADPADAGIAAGMQDRAIAVETLGEAVALVGWPLPDAVPHPLQYARWARGRTRARIDEMIRLGDYDPALYVERKEATDALRGFVAQSEAPLLLVEGSSGTGKSNWLAHEAARILASAGPETAVVLTSAHDVTATSQPEDLTPDMSLSARPAWIAELASRGAEIVWLIDGLETDSDPRSWVANHVVPIVEALNPGALGRLKVVLVGQPHAVAPLTRDEGVTRYVFDSAPPDPKAPQAGLSARRPVLRLDGFDEAGARAAYQARSTTGGCLTPWYALPEGVRQVLALPVMGRVFHGLYAGMPVSESLGVRELLAKAADDRLNERAGRLHGGSPLVPTARALLGSLAVYLWENPDKAAGLTKAVVTVLAESEELPVTGGMDTSALSDSILDLLKLVLASGLLREEASPGRKVLRFELDVWPAYFLAEHVAAARGSAGVALMELCRREDPGAYGERAAELLAARALAGSESRGAWAEALASDAEPWAWTPLLQAWLDAAPDVMGAAAVRWVEVNSPERAVEHITRWNEWLPAFGRPRVAMTRMLWIRALRTITGIDDPDAVREETWGAQVEEALSQSSERVRELAIGLGRLGWALQVAKEPHEAARAHREAVALFRLLCGVRDASNAMHGLRVQRALSQTPESVRELALELRNLGRALTGAGQPHEAVRAHRTGVALARLLCGVHDPAEMGQTAWVGQVKAALSTTPERVHDLWVGLDGLGLALDSAGEPHDASRVHSEGVALCRLLCGVPDPAEVEQEEWAARGAAARFRFPERVRDLALGLDALGTALWSAAEPHEAARAHREEVALCRLLCGVRDPGEVGEATWGTEVDAALSRSPERVQELSIGLGRLGWALESAQESLEAARAHREEVALCRLLCGVRDPGEVGETTWGTEVDAALSRSPERVQELSIGLGRLGWALRGGGEPRRAAAAHREAVALCRVLCGVQDRAEVGQDAWSAQVTAALSRSPERVRELSIGLGRFGKALREGGDPQSAAHVHREAVALCRVLCGVQDSGEVGQEAWSEQVTAALSRSPERVRELSIELDALGQTLDSAGSAKEASRTHREAVALWRRLCGVQDPREVGQQAWRMQVEAALSRYPERVRELSIGLGGLGQAYWSAEKHQRAERAHREAVALWRRLCGVQDPREVGQQAWRIQVEAALSRYPERVRELSIELGRLGQALDGGGEPQEAARAHGEEVALCRLLCGVQELGEVGQEAWSVQVKAALSRLPERVRDLSIGLGRLGLVLDTVAMVPEAVRAGREALALSRFLCGVQDPDQVDEATWVRQVEAALSTRPERLRDLAIGLDELGQALDIAGEPQEATRAIGEAVAIFRRLCCIQDVAEVGSAKWERQVEAALSAWPERVRELSLALGRLGVVLGSAGQTQKSAAAWGAAVALWRLFSGVPDRAKVGEAAWLQHVESALSHFPERVRVLSIGLDGLGQALRGSGEMQEAARATSETVALWRVSCGVQDPGEAGQAAWGEQVDTALSCYPERVQDLAIGLGKFGLALDGEGCPQEAVRGHGEEVALRRLLCGVQDPCDVGQQAWEAQVNAALSRFPERVRELSLGLGRLGQALGSAQDPQSAARAHGEEVALMRLLASIQDPAEVGEAAWEAQVEAALSRFPERVRELSIGLGSLGTALKSAQDPQTAVRARGEEVALWRLLCGVQDPQEVGVAAWVSQVEAALSRFPERVRELAIGLLESGVLMWSLDATNAVPLHEESAALMRGVAQLPAPGALPPEERQLAIAAVVSRVLHLVIETVLCLKAVSGSYWKTGRSREAEAALNEAGELEGYLNDR